MASKRPLCVYDGATEELHLSDSVLGAGDPDILSAILVEEVVRNRFESQAKREIIGGVADGFYSSAGIDAGLSSGYTYDATNDKVTPHEGDPGATQDRLPTGGGTDYGSYFSPYLYTNIDDPVGSPDTATYVAYESGGGGANEYYTFSTFSVPAGATITKLRMTFRIYNGYNEGSLQWSSIGPRLKVGGSFYTGTTQSSHDAWGTFTEDWTVNPKTSAAWTVNDINGTGANPLQQFGLGMTGNYNECRCTQAYLTVYYEDPSVNMVLVTTATTGLVTAVKAIAVLLIENYDVSALVYFSSASTPSWTQLTGLTKVCSPLSGVDAYVTDVIAVSGSADKSHRLKILADAGNSTAIYGYSFMVMA